MLEEFIPVLANFSDLAFAGLASSGFSDSWVTAGVCPTWPLPGAVPSKWGWGSGVTGPVYSGTSFTAERFWVSKLNAFSKSSNLSFNPLI